MVGFCRTSRASLPHRTAILRVELLSGQFEEDLLKVRFVGMDGEDLPRPQQAVYLFARRGVLRRFDGTVRAGPYGDVVAGEPQFQPFRLVAGHQMAFGEDADAVADGVRLGHVVRGQEHRGAGGFQFAKHAVHLGPRGGVEPAGGFVEEQQLGRMDHRRQQGGSLAHALRTVLDQRLGVLVQPHAGEQRPDAALRHAAQACVEAQVVRDAQPFVQGAGVREDADAFVVGFARALDRTAEQRDASGILDQLAGQQLDGGGLARAGGAEEPERLAAPHGEGEVVQHLLAAEGQADAIHRHDGRHRMLLS